MDWSNEAYVRLYVRNTTTWRRLGFEGQTILMHLMRVVDRSGVLDIEDMSPAEATALHTGAPAEFAAIGVAKLLELGTLVHDESRLVFPNFIPANETPKSDKQRQKESREYRAVTKRDKRSRTVTAGHEIGSDVTNGHSASQRVTLNSAQLNSAQRSTAQLDEPDLAIVGRVWLREVLGRDDYDHGVRQWRRAFEQLALKPETEKAAAAAAIGRELDKPGVRRMLTPEHVLAYWSRYSDGEAPGPRLVSAQSLRPGESEIMAKEALVQRLQEQLLSAENDTKARVIKGHIDTAQSQLAKLKEQHRWTA